jgi:hypothetical protein
MPSPVFIVCSEGGSIDRHTNMVSIFDVIEKITFKVFAKSSEGLPPPNLQDALPGGKPASLNTLRVTAVWRRADDDENREFEFKTTVQFPGSSEQVLAGEGRFVFNTILYRIISTVYSDMPSQSGAIIVTSSVRRVGSAEWLDQQYVIPVERMDSSNQPRLPLSDRE